MRSQRGPFLGNLISEVINPDVEISRRAAMKAGLDLKEGSLGGVGTLRMRN